MVHLWAAGAFAYAVCALLSATHTAPFSVPPLVEDSIENPTNPTPPNVGFGRIVAEYLRELAAHKADETVRGNRNALTVFQRWAEKADLAPHQLSRSRMLEFLEAIRSNGQHDRPRKLSTVRYYVDSVIRLWARAHDHEEWGAFIPRPRRIPLPSPAATPVFAPTWAQMDAAILALESAPMQRVTIVLRYTGLRVGQAMRLIWDDVDLGRATLTIRGELGKSIAERSGRIIPISRYFAEYLAEIRGAASSLSPIVPDVRAPGRHARSPRHREIIAAWNRAGVPTSVWQRRSFHAFRKGFVSELRRAGADRDAVEVLVGHRLPGMLSDYVDPDALPMRAAVKLIPRGAFGAQLDLFGGSQT